MVNHVYLYAPEASEAIVHSRHKREECPTADKGYASYLIQAPDKLEEARGHCGGKVLRI